VSRAELESTAGIPQLKKTKGKDGKSRTTKPSANGRNVADIPDATTISRPAAPRSAPATSEFPRLAAHRVVRGALFPTGRYPTCRRLKSLSATVLSAICDYNGGYLTTVDFSVPFALPGAPPSGPPPLMRATVALTTNWEGPVNGYRFHYTKTARH
jgi:hypothetical protein